MPTSNENRVRVEFLSKMTATPRGPSSGRRLNGSFFSSAASVQHLGLLGGRQVVVAQEVPSHRCRLRPFVEDARQRGDERRRSGPR